MCLGWFEGAPIIRSEKEPYKRPPGVGVTAGGFDLVPGLVLGKGKVALDFLVALKNCDVLLDSVVCLSGLTLKVFWPVATYFGIHKPLIPAVQALY